MKAEYIDHMGDDLRVVNAARVSFDKESDWEYCGIDYCTDKCEENGITCPDLNHQDKKLIHYLASHNHWTPFSHCQVTMRETVPIFVARQRFKHMVGFTYNEVSRRYVDDEPEFYAPDVWRKRAENKKQGSSEEYFTGDEPDFGFAYAAIGENTANNAYGRLIDHARCLYDDLLEYGVAPEQARMVLPQSMYTSYYVTGSLAAWARAYKLRIDKDAQKEIQDLASQWNGIISPLYPVSWEALTKGT